MFEPAPREQRDIDKAYPTQPPAEYFDQKLLKYPSRDKRTILYGVSLLLDIASMLGGYGLALFVREPQWLESGGVALITVAMPLFIMFEIAREVQSEESLNNRVLAIQRSIAALSATALVVIGLTFLFGSENLSRLGFMVTFGGAAFFIIISKILVDLLFKRILNGSATTTILLLDGLAADPGLDAEPAAGYECPQHRRNVGAADAEGSSHEHRKRDAVLGTGMRVQQHRDEHNQVAQQDRPHGLPPIHPAGDKAGGEHVGGDADAHRDPQRSVIVDAPGALCRRDGSEVLVEEPRIARGVHLGSVAHVAGFEHLHVAR